MCKSEAIVLNEVGNWPQYKEIMLDELLPDCLKVDVLSSAINHRDIWICKGKYPGIKCPVVLGSDALVHYKGADYIVLPGLNWGNNQDFQDAEYTMLGGAINGTFSKNMNIPKDSLFPKPEHLTKAEAGALPLAGLTAYRALFVRGEFQSGQKVFINGIGGGVAMMTFDFAKALGAEIWVSSSSKNKLDYARNRGAAGTINYTEKDWTKKLIKKAGLFDIIVDGAGGPDFSGLVKAAAPGGRIVIYGGGQGKIDAVSPQVLFWRQISICGTTMGSPEDFEDMLAFVTRHKIHPQVDSVFSLSDYLTAFERMDKGLQMGKIVFDHSI